MEQYDKLRCCRFVNLLIDLGISVFTFLDEVKDSFTTRDFNDPNKKDTIRTKNDDWWALTITMLYSLLKRYCNYDEIFDHNNFTEKNQSLADIVSIGILKGKLTKNNKKKFERFIKNNKNVNQDNFHIHVH